MSPTIYFIHDSGCDDNFRFGSKHKSYLHVMSSTTNKIYEFNFTTLEFESKSTFFDVSFYMSG